MRSSGYRAQADRRVFTADDIYAGCTAFTGTADSNRGRDRRNRGRRLEGPRSDRSGRRIGLLPCYNAYHRIALQTYDM